MRMPAIADINIQSIHDFRPFRGPSMTAVSRLRTLLA